MMNGPELLVGEMRAQGQRWIETLCHCGHADSVTIDDLPDRLAVSAVRERLTCSRCGARPRQTRPSPAPLRRPSRPHAG